MYKVAGFVTSNLKNRRLTWRLFLLYQLVFQLIGALILAIVLLPFDENNTILTNPVGYAARYALSVGLVAALIYSVIFRSHAKHIIQKFAIRIVSRRDEMRYVDIAEKQCIALGLRVPQFGILETDALNTITVGEGPKSGLIAVTRGLLNSLDDDELANVIAHEAAHIKNGDTAVMAANHAMLRTALNLQLNNPLRIEDWRQSFIILALPFMLPLYLISGAVSYVAIQLARMVRSEIDVLRDLMADGDAVRATHFPGALASAIRKINGNGAFPGWYKASGLMFEEPDGEDNDATERAIRRIDNLKSIAGSLMAVNRSRMDTRNRENRRFLADEYTLPPEPTEPPEVPGLTSILSDWGEYWRAHSAYVDWHQWHGKDKRNILGVKPLHLLPFLAISGFLLTFHYPKDGDFNRYANVFDPSALVAMAQTVKHKPVCYETEGEVTQACYAKDGKRMPYQYEAAVIIDPRQIPITLLVIFLYIIAFFTPEIRHYVIPGYNRGEHNVSDSLGMVVMPNYGRQYGGGPAATLLAFLLGNAYNRNKATATDEMPLEPLQPRSIDAHKVASFDMKVRQQMAAMGHKPNAPDMPNAHAPILATKRHKQAGEQVVSVVQDTVSMNGNPNNTLTELVPDPLRPLVSGFGRKNI